MRPDRIIIAWTAVLALAALAGCGGKSATIPYTGDTGNLNGFIYVNKYNETLLRSADAEPPTGKEPVPNALVTVDTGEKDHTDDNGYFSITGIPAGANHTVTVTHANLETLIITGVPVNKDATTTLNNVKTDDQLTMKPASGGSGTLVVTAVASSTYSVPVTATVFINGNNTGKTTSPAATFDDIYGAASGATYSVHVEATGYETPPAQQATITPSQTTTLTFSLTSTTGNNPPYAAIITPADGSTFTAGASITFSGTGADGEDGTLSGASLAWSSSIDGPIGTGTFFQKSDLSIGTHTVTLNVTDSQGVSSADAVTVGVAASTAANTPPTATIILPTSGSSYTQSQTVYLSGAGADAEDVNIPSSSLAWTSSLDGPIGTGSALSKNDFSTGTHTITLTATDSGGLSGADSVTITVTEVTTNNPPTATIYTPTSGAEFASGATVIFTGAGADVEDGALTGSSLAWTSSLDDAIGTGTAFTKNNLSAGAHTITLTATDSDANTDTDTVTITITQSTTNTAPTAAIVTPTDGAAFTSGAVVFFIGGATDAEDAALTGSSLAWTSSLDGPIGTGTNFTKTNLSAGAHTITLTATDSGGLSDTATVNITVQ
ncbi:MAG: carboxypeptidase regulatory-like domain-containing protein [bacterium]